jgi:uncharacterized protein YhfF
MNDAEFAFPGELRDRLVAAVLRSEKTAMSSLRAECEEDRRDMDSTGRPVEDA